MCVEGLGGKAVSETGANSCLGCGDKLGRDSRSSVKSLRTNSIIFRIVGEAAAKEGSV